MNTPFPGISVKFETEGFNIDITDMNEQTSVNFNDIRDVTNYEYEVKKNEEKRKILILKPEYLPAFLSDMRNIMKYGKSSQYINDNTKRAYNPKLKGIWKGDLRSSPNINYIDASLEK